MNKAILYEAYLAEYSHAQEQVFEKAFETRDLLQSGFCKWIYEVEGTTVRLLPVIFFLGPLNPQTCTAVTFSLQLSRPISVRLVCWRNCCQVVLLDELS